MKAVKLSIGSLLILMLMRKPIANTNNGIKKWLLYIKYFGRSKSPINLIVSVMQVIRNNKSLKVKLL
tara:strand:- start:233 stop:433 length:201 start_codon:yes stop_codon:yes gene_type:complete